MQTKFSFYYDEFLFFMPNATEATITAQVHTLFDKFNAAKAKDIEIRSPAATRPWEHVLEPLSGYLRLGEKMTEDPVRYAERLTERIGEEPCNAALLVERGRWYYRRQEWGKALNDFNRALGIDPARDEARQYAEQIEEILAFRYKDIYNP